MNYFNICRISKQPFVQKFNGSVFCKYKPIVTNFNQVIAFSSLEKVKEQKVVKSETNGNCILIEQYNELIRSNKIERDPYQYNLILILQTLQNNINQYYHHVESYVKNYNYDEEIEINGSVKEERERQRNFRSLIHTIFSKKNKQNINEEISRVEKGDELNEKEEYENNDCFFIFKNNISKNKGEFNKQLVYRNIKNEEDCRISSNIPLENIQYIRGIYIHGSVGRGKTYFLNMLFDNLKITKLKIHYHNFMQEIYKMFHEEKLNNRKDPIKNISIKLNRKYKLIFIDEFQIVHISDAMIIKSLFNYLFHYGTILLCSSNRNPVHLYHNGLNRDRFIPFIKLLYKFNYVYEIDNYFDFRVKNRGTVSNVYNIPSMSFEKIKKICQELYAQVYQKSIQEIELLANENRKLFVSNLKNQIIPYEIDRYAIFSFKDLCSSNISVNEYTAIANGYHTLFIYDIERMNEEINGNELRRFILLIDILYEKNIRVFFFSDIPLFQLFPTSDIISNFQMFLEKIKSKYVSFDEFVKANKKLLKKDSFDRSILGTITNLLDITSEVSEKLFDAMNYNINMEYIHMEHLRKILCFHIMNYEIDTKKYLKFVEKREKDISLDFIPYLLFDENVTDTSQENVFASMRTLSRMKHMSTESYLSQHKKLYENTL